MARCPGAVELLHERVCGMPSPTPQLIKDQQAAFARAFAIKKAGCPRRERPRTAYNLASTCSLPLR